MREHDIRALFRRLGVQIKSQRVSARGFLEFPCPLAPVKHKSGTDRHASAAVKVVDGGVSVWACQGCKSRGNLARFVAEVTRVKTGRVDQALVDEVQTSEDLGLASDLPRWGDRPTKPEPPQPLDEAIFDGLYPPAWDIPDARAYMEGRGLNKATADHLELAWDDEQRRILFPIRGRKSELYGWSGRAIDARTEPKIKDYAGLEKRWMVLGCHLWVPDLPVLVVEGLFGYAHLLAIGADAICNPAAILGSHLTEEKAMVLRRFRHPTYLAFDNDEAGDIGLFGSFDERGRRKRGEGAVAALRQHVPVFAPVWPEGKDDPDQLTFEEVESWLRETPLCP